MNLLYLFQALEVTASYLLIITNCFTVLTSSRKLANFGGVAPHPHKSGTSIKGKTRTSPIADKKLKALLSNGVGSLIQHNVTTQQLKHTIAVDKKSCWFSLWVYYVNQSLLNYLKIFHFFFVIINRLISVLFISYLNTWHVAIIIRWSSVNFTTVEKNPKSKLKLYCVVNCYNSILFVFL